MTVPFASGLIEDLRRSLRSLRYSPGLAVVAVTALALGIGFTTTMFGIVHGATRDLPVTEPEELVAFAERVPGRGIDDLEGLGAFELLSVNISRDHAHPERLTAAAITPNSFRLLEVSASRGRLFTEADATEAD